MTRLIFIPDRQTFILLESPLSPPELVMAVVRGHWQPPAPYGNAGPLPLEVSEQGQVVIVTLKEEPVHAPEISLTPRQQEVLQCLAEGLTNKQISQRLGMSARTLFNHQTSLKESLHVNTLAQAAALGAVLGLCQPKSGD